MTKPFSTILKELRQSKNWSQDELAKRVGTSKQVISRYERGERSPKIGDAKRLAEALGVTIGQLNGETIPANVKPMNTLQPHRVPMLGEVAAGEPIVTEREYEVWVDAPMRADYALTIKGDSMNPTYLEGDVIYIRKQPNVDHDGQVAVVVLDDTATVKHVYRQKDGLLLVSDNPAYPPMFKPFDEYNSVYILGKVVGFTRMYGDDHGLS